MIYFIRSASKGRIKIGTTIRLSERLLQLAREHGDDLEIVAVTDGSYEREAEFHRRFSHLRAFGEWFEPGDDLLGFIIAEGREWDGIDEADPPPSLVTVKISRVLHARLKIVSTVEGKDIAEILNEIVGEPLSERYNAALLKLNEGSV